MKKPAEHQLTRKPILSELPDGIFDSTGNRLAHSSSSQEAYTNMSVRVSVESTIFGIPVGERREEVPVGPARPCVISPDTALVFVDGGPGFEKLVVCDQELFREKDHKKTYARLFEKEGGRRSLAGRNTVDFTITRGLGRLIKTRVEAMLVE